MNKKAVSFSTNFIVVVIFMILVLGLCFLLFNRFMGQSEATRAALDSRYVNEVQRLMAEGEKVAVYPQNIEMQPGKSTAIGIGILNNAGSEKTFQINATCNATITPTGEINNCNPAMVSLLSKNVSLKNNEQKIMPIVISMKKEIARGTYIINIEVRTADNAGYDGLTHKVYVQV